MFGGEAETRLHRPVDAQGRILGVAPMPRVDPVNRRVPVSGQGQQRAYAIHRTGE